MKKRKKLRTDRQTNKRVVTYLSDDMLIWVRGEAEKIGLNESAFMRYLIKTNMGVISD